MSQGVHSFCEKGQRNLDRRTRGAEWKRYKQVSHIFCILRTHFTQHTVVNIPIALPPPPPPPPLLSFPIYHIIAARVLTWLDLFLTSLVGFSPPFLLLFFFIFSPATCCMLSVSAAEIYEVQHATTPCPRGASGWNWLDIYIYLWGGQGCLTAWMLLKTFVYLHTRNFLLCAAAVEMVFNRV